MHKAGDIVVGSCLREQSMSDQWQADKIAEFRFGSGELDIYYMLRADHDGDTYDVDFLHLIDGAIYCRDNRSPIMASDDWITIREPTDQELARIAELHLLGLR